MDSMPCTKDKATVWYSSHLQFVRGIGAGCAWTLAGTAAAQAGALLSAVLAARLLGRDAFGAYGAVQTTALTLANIASAGLGISATYYLAQTARADPKRAGRIAGLISLVTLITATALSIGLAVLSSQLGAFLSGGAAMNRPLRLAALYVFFATLGGYQTGALIGLQAYRAIASAGLVQAFVLPAAMYTFTRSFGLPGSVLAFDVAAIVLWAIQHFCLRAEMRNRGIRVVYSGWRKESRILSRFALPAACSGVCGNLGIWGASAVLLRGPDGLSQFALFTAANSLRSLILFVPAIVNKVAVPAFARLRSLARLRESFWPNVQLNAALAILIAGVMSVCGESILGLFGKHFRATGLFVLMMGAACFEVTAAALFQALVNQGAIWTHVGVMALWSTLLLLVTAILAGRMGAVALALGFLAAWCASAVAYAWFAARILSGPNRREIADRLPALADGSPAAAPLPWTLAVLMGLSRLIPPVRGAATIAFRCIRPLYRRRGPCVAPVWSGVRMLLDPADYLGGFLAFLPHVYERWERRAIASILRPGDVFIDVGSNIGAYSLWAMRCMGNSGRVLAIEPEERNYRMLLENIRLNGFNGAVSARQCGVSDRRHELRLHRSVTGNCGGHNFAGRGSEGPSIECFPLYEVVSEADLGPIRMMKLDIEGFELKVLRRYFNDAPLAETPRYLLVEIEDGPAPESEKASLRGLLAARGYRPLRESGNTLFERSGVAV